MIITKECLEKITTTNIDSNVEFGGILGRDGSGVITEIFFDKGIRNDDIPFCCYYPDVDVLNEVIGEWSEKGIEFCGIYHTHYSDTGSFSEYDKDYMRKILEAMPDDRKSLFFPLLLFPSAILRSYAAAISPDGDMSVSADNITTV